MLSPRFQNLFWKVLARLTSPFARPCEKKFLNKHGTQPLAHQPVFIIGAPRTGSTILYQALTHYFDVLFIDNFTCHWHKNISLGFWLSRNIYGNKPHNNFLSTCGNTFEYGGHAPSECGKFWYRWLPRDHHFIDYPEITESIVNQIRCEIKAISNYYQRPLIFKNLNAGQRLRLLRKCFPDARFIYTQRRRDQVISSIRKARNFAGVKEHQWWSVKPANFRELQELPELDMIERQIESIESQIENDLTLFPKENWRVVQYDRLSPSLIIELGEWLGLKHRTGALMPKFEIPA